MIRSTSPADLDPLEAAGTPITPDPPVGARVNGSGADANAIEKIARRLIQGGMDPSQAYAQARQQVLGEKQAVLDSMGPPPGTRRPQPTEEAPAVPEVPAGRQPRTPEELRDMGFNPYTVPGPTMPDGRRAAPTRAIPNVDAAEAYNYRPEAMPATDPSDPGGTARYYPSQRDRAEIARGSVPVYTPDGVSYQLSPDTGVRGLPGSPGRGGRRADLESPLRDEKGNAVLEDGKVVPNWVVTEAQSPTGTLGEAEGSATVPVYSLSPRARQKHEAYLAERRMYRQAQAARMSPAEFLEKNKDSYPDLTAGGIRQGLPARIAAESGRQADFAERDKRWKAQMMLAGRNPRQNAANAFLAMNDPDTNDWQRLVLATRLGQGVDGMTPLGVQASHNNQLTQLGLRVANGRGFQNMDPVQAEALQQQVDAKKPVSVRAQEHVAAGRLNHPDVLEHANAIVNQHYSAPTVLGNTSRFADNEVALAAQRLADQTGMSIEDATRVMRGIQDERNQNASASTIVNWFYDR